MGGHYTIKRAVANVPLSSTDFQIVAAVSSPLKRRIRVLGLILTGGTAATTAVLNSKGSGAGTAISQIFNLGVGQVASLDISDYGWFETNAGEALTLTSGAGAGGVGVTVLYDDQG